ncbi:hypothetical protein AB6O49_02835 [Streptomyces sp. SBR177]|uniref:hypothetical protein n=1 Tax=Streptomyces sp. NPDC046275 TaxID=3157201 RepID=UPI0033DFD8E4
MAIFVHAVLDGITTDQYDALNARLQTVPGIFEGCVSHTCTTTDKGLEIFDTWESEEHMKAFGEKMMPIAAELGLPEIPSEPRVLPVHNQWAPGGAG